MRIWVLAITLALACGSQCAFGSTDRVRVSAKDNLRYQLDCLAGVIRCTKVANTLSASISDDPVATQKLADWRSHREALSAPPDASTRSISALPPITDLANATGRETGPGRITTTAIGDFDNPVEHQLLAYFSPKFQADWQQYGANHLGRLKSEMHLLFAQSDLDEVIDSISAFLNTDAASVPVATLVALPDSSGGSLATLDNNHIYLESPRGDSARNRVPVLAHEYVHFWLAHQTPQASAELATAFADHPSPCNIVAFNLFEESLASALGNGLIEQRLNSRQRFAEYLAIPDSFYADRDIDSIAKAILPTVAKYVAAGRTIDRAFVTTFVDRAEATLGVRCQSLALGMRTSAMVLSSPAFAEVSQLARERWRTATMFTDVTAPALSHESALANYTAITGAIVTTSGDLKDMRVLPTALRMALQRIAEQHSRFVYAWPRTHGSTVYVIVGDSETAATNTMLQLIVLQQLRFSGLWLPPPLPDQVAGNINTRNSRITG